ncbi:nucleoside-diphosphate sugar epimerase [Bacterioplanes sanyensis]|uniref:Nucleoside-diphosphate sugar epimerase n=1 Tax=Bacterioplanes sanyensis TaxID=1249553 RepID=A0A222FFY4_9GAMM|nr:nucleoside-diphosphate sugar epimerase/dehydratase [Bacterioplanes sanyensis]ASP37496.1 nucleoside-diphosphate sugar epimerase [Bacterioplanes sanyensis]
MFERFLQWPRLIKRLMTVASDILVLGLALWGSVSLHRDQLYAPSQHDVLLYLLTLTVTVAVFIRLGLYRAVLRFLSDRAILTISAGSLCSVAALWFFSLLLQKPISSAVLVTYGALAFLFVGGTRFGTRALINRPGARNKEAVGIVGVGDTARQLASALQQGTEFRPAAFFAPTPVADLSLIAAIPVYNLGHAERVVRELGLKKLLLALDESAEDVPPSFKSRQRLQVLNQLESLSVPVQAVPSVSCLVSGRVRISDIRDLEVEDLLGRESVSIHNEQVQQAIAGCNVLVTGAGGSIGSELCRQILRQQPQKLVLFEQSEYALYQIERELRQLMAADRYEVELVPVLGSVLHRRRCSSVMTENQVELVYHAAAYKHVPLVEHNVIEGVQNNVFGTWYAAEAAIEAGVQRFVLISTDKAVRPPNVMGASKRLAELVLQGLATRQSATVFTMVRFGNVLGSSGSVVPLFREQIREGGPVTVTHPDICRFFMTIPEAAQLVLQAGTMAGGGEVFVLDMGEPVKIADLARKMIHLMGLTEKTLSNPGGDIEVVFTGLRPGEKLFEELLIGNDPQGTTHPRIMMAREHAEPWHQVSELLEQLSRASRAFDRQRIIQLLYQAPLGYQPVERPEASGADIGMGASNVRPFKVGGDKAG